MEKSLRHITMFQAFSIIKQGSPDSPQQYTVSINAQLQYSDNLLLKQSCLLSAGITRLPSYFIAKEIKNGKLMASLNAHFRSPNYVSKHAPYLEFETFRAT